MKRHPTENASSDGLRRGEFDFLTVKRARIDADSTNPTVSLTLPTSSGSLLVGGGGGGGGGAGVDTVSNQTVGGKKTWTGDAVFNGPGGTGLGVNTIYVNPIGSSFGSAANVYFTALKDPSVAATGTLTNASTLYVAGAPNVGSGGGSITNAYAIYAPSGVVRFDDKVQTALLNNGADINVPTSAGTLALTSQIPTNSTYVDLTTNQSISGTKTFSTNPQIAAITSDGTHTQTLPTTTGTVALTSDIPTNATYVDLTSTQTISGAKTVSNVLTSTNSTYAAGGAGAIVALTGGIQCMNLSIGGTISRSLSSSLSGLISAFTNSITDTSSAGTQTNLILNSWLTPTIQATNARTYTKAVNVYLAGAPALSTNATFTNVYGLYVDTASVTSATVTESCSLYVAGKVNTTSATNEYAFKVAADTSYFGGLLTCAAGVTASGAISNDFSGSSGTFKTSTGANTLSGLASCIAGLKIASDGSTITRFETGNVLSGTVGAINALSAVDVTINFAHSFSSTPNVFVVPYATGGGVNFSDYVLATVRNAGTSSFTLHLVNLNASNTVVANSTYAWMAFN